MATKKAAAKAPAASSSNDMSTMWKWVYVAGVVVAGLAAALSFTAADPYLGWALILVGILVGIFYFDSADIMNFGLRYLVLLAVAAAAPLASVPAVGGFISGFFSGFASFLGPIVLTMIVIYFWKKYFGS